MSLTRIESDIVDIPASQQHAFNFLSDFTHFEKMMPPQVENWQATADECSFTVKGMAKIGMKIVKRNPFSSIHIESAGEKMPLKFELTVKIEETGPVASKGQIIFESDMNPMIRMMAEKPLTNFFNLLAQRMKDIRQDT